MIVPTVYCCICYYENTHSKDYHGIPPHIRYRYTVEELNSMLLGIQARSQSYTDWCRQVDTILDGVGEDKSGIYIMYIVVRSVL